MGKYAENIWKLCREIKQNDVKICKNIWKICWEICTIWKNISVWLWFFSPEERGENESRAHECWG